MSHRLEKGYILPGQADFLYSVAEVTAMMSAFRLASLAALDLKGGLLKPDWKADISA